LFAIGVAILRSSALDSSLPLPIASQHQHGRHTALLPAALRSSNVTAVLRDGAFDKFPRASDHPLERTDTGIQHSATGKKRRVNGRAMAFPSSGGASCRTDSITIRTC